MLVSRVVLKASGCFEDAERRILAFSTRTACSCVFHGKVHSQITVGNPQLPPKRASWFFSKQAIRGVWMFSMCYFCFLYCLLHLGISPISHQTMSHVPPGNSSWPTRCCSKHARKPWAYVHYSLLQALRPSAFTKEGSQKWLRPLTRPMTDPSMEYYVYLHFAWFFNGKVVGKYTNFYHGNLSWVRMSKTFKIR